MPLVTLLWFVAIGAAFGLAATVVARRFGRARVPLLWLLASIGLGSIGAARAVAFQRSIGRGPEHVSAPGTFALLISATAITFSITAVQVWRREASRDTALASLGRRTWASAGWTFLGFLVMMLIAAALDLANVNFLPFR